MYRAIGPFNVRKAGLNCPASMIVICCLPEFYNRMLIIDADLFEVPEYVLI
jgi:hypothetical protein